MRKIRTAAVAVMVAGLGFAGAGTAVAGGHGGGVDFDQSNAAQCAPSNVQHNASLLGDVNLGLGLGVLGVGKGTASSDRSVTQSCAFDLGNEIG